MSRTVYIGGFSSGETSAAEVGEALSNHYEDVDTFTFPQAMANPDVIRRATERVDTIVHSAGMLALDETVRPNEVHSFGAPIPTSRSAFIGRTMLKSAQMFSRIRTPGDVIAAGKFHVRSGAELFLPTRALGHWKPFLSGEISRFNAIEASEMLAGSGSRVELNYGEADAYFQIPEDVRQQARAIPNVELRILPNQTHDDFVLDPDKIIGEYLNSK